MLDNFLKRDLATAILMIIAVFFIAAADGSVLAALFSAIFFGLAAFVHSIKPTVQGLNKYYFQSRFLTLFKNGDHKYKASFFVGRNIWIMYDRGYKRLTFSFGHPTYKSHAFLVQDYSETI